MDLFQFDGTYVLGMPSLMVGCSRGSPRILSALEYAKIKKFRLTPKIWSIDGSELTPTLKLRRKIILIDGQIDKQLNMIAAGKKC